MITEKSFVNQNNWIRTDSKDTYDDLITKVHTI